MAKWKMPEKEQEIKSNIYLLECRGCKPKRQFEKRILGDRWLEDIKGHIYEMYRDDNLKKNLRIGYVECNKCHSSSHLRIVKRLDEEEL